MEKIFNILHSFGNRFGVHDAKIKLLMKACKEDNISEVKELINEVNLTCERMLEVWQQLKNAARGTELSKPTAKVSDIIERFNKLDAPRLERDYGINIIIKANIEMDAVLQLSVDIATQITEYIVSICSKTGADTLFIELISVKDLVYINYRDNGNGMDADRKDLLSAGITEFGTIKSISIIRDLAQESGGYMKDIKSVEGLGSEYSLVYKKVA